MSKKILACLLLVCSFFPVFGEESPELRGIWITPRSGMAVWNQAEIAQAIETSAKHNFNVVYFNVWSRGWPLWRSELFHRETGFYADPVIGDRDLLEEAVEEAKKHKIHIEAWFEYGFVAWWTGNDMPQYPKGPLFARYPEWLARKSDGSEAFPSGHTGVFYWMNHNHLQAQFFLISLAQEVAKKYELGGIELDRIRYPGLDCGYDPYTSALYKKETGAFPPQDPANAAWKRWRADKLVQFQSNAYDAIKAVNPKLIVSNAPSHYSSGDAYPAYDNFLQDWRTWLNIGKLDAAQVQMYVKPEYLKTYIPSALKGLENHAKAKVFAGIAARTSSFTLSEKELIDTIQTVRASALLGNSFWYYNDLKDLDYFETIRANVYRDAVPLPYRTAQE